MHLESRRGYRRPACFCCIVVLMSGTRTYRMSTRAAAAEATRERIIEAARPRIQQRVVRRRDAQGNRGRRRGGAADAGQPLRDEGGVVRRRGRALRREDRVRPRAVAVDDIAGAITTLVDDYDESGDAILRMLALEDRIAVLRPALERGRAGIEQWVERVFAAALERLRGAESTRRIAQLVVVTDVYTLEAAAPRQGTDRNQTILADARAGARPAQRRRRRLGMTGYPDDDLGRGRARRRP